MPRVLLVERDPTLREWFRLHLAAQGLMVVAFDDGRRALEAARLEPPDLLLVAADLPTSGAFASGRGDPVERANSANPDLVPGTG